MKHVDPRGLSPGYAHQLGFLSGGLQFGGVISGGNLRGIILRAPKLLTLRTVGAIKIYDVPVVAC